VVSAISVNSTSVIAIWKFRLFVYALAIGGTMYLWHRANWTIVASF
jgi:hypothetical protein